MKGKSVLAILMAIFLLLPLIGCGDTGTKTSNEDVSSGTETAKSADQEVKPESDEPITITLLHMNTKESTFTPAFNKLIDSFVEKHPNVTVEQEANPGTAPYVTKFNTYVVADTLPDVFATRDDFNPDLVAQNKIRALDDILDGGWKDKFIPMWAEQTVNGKIYGIPYQFITNQAIYYNENILKELGYKEFPKTWEEWLKLLEKEKQAGYIPISLGAVEGWPLWSHIGEPLTQFICGNEWVANCAKFDGSTKYTDANFVKTMTMINDLMLKGYLNDDVVAINSADAQQYYVTGKAATMMSGSWTAAGLQVDAPEEIYNATKVAPLPRPADSKPEVEYGMFTGGSGWAYGINSKISDEKLSLCVELIKTLTGNDAAIAMLEQSNMPSLTIDKIEGVGNVELKPLLQQFLECVAAAPAVYQMNRQQNGTTMCDIIYKKSQEMLTGTITPEQACADIQAVYEEYSASK